MVANRLHRKSTGLTEAHAELVEMLAAIAVKDYLAEVEAGAECMDEAHQQPEELTQ